MPVKSAGAIPAASFPDESSREDRQWRRLRSAAAAFAAAAAAVAPPASAAVGIRRKGARMWEVLGFKGLGFRVCDGAGGAAGYRSCGVPRGCGKC